ncbi:MAG: acyltransferase, partial [Dokdonella sp.]
IPGFEGLRLSHFLSIGWAGVDLFFCLSAFLLVLPYAHWRHAGAPRPDTAQYLMRRVRRIYPAYLAQLAILLVLAGVFGVGRMLTPGEFIAHLFLWFNMGRDWVAPLLGVWFTLPIEFTFYLLLPLLAPLIDRRRWPWLLLTAIGITIAYRMIMFNLVAGEPVPVRVIEIERLPGRIDQFVIGMLAGSAFVAASLRGWRPRQPASWFFAGVLGITIVIAALIINADAYWQGHWLLFVWHGLFATALVPLLLGAAWSAKPAMTLLANRVMRHLGAISFGVYLWHMPLVLALVPYLPTSLSTSTRFWLLLALVLPATLVLAQLSHVFIERPFLRRTR